MRVTVLFFGVLRDTVGLSREEVELPAGSALHDAFASYTQRFPPLAALAPSIVMARNREFAVPATILAEGDEIAFLPPVSGGCGRPDPEIAEPRLYCTLTRHPIGIPPIAARLLTGAEGAVVTFEGTVRNHTNHRPTLYLDYECYEAMALPTMARLGRDLLDSRPIERIAIVHRLGRLLIGETSVAIIVTAAHRRPAFEAALEAIDRLKKTVPIWKKEAFADGEVWVEGEWDANLPAAG